MRGSVMSEVDVDLPAQEMWDIYSSPDFPFLLLKLMPDKFEYVKFTEGDGHEGSVLELGLKTSAGIIVGRERIQKIDNETRTKVMHKLGGPAGFSDYNTIFNFIETGPESSILRTTVTYDLIEGSESIASLPKSTWTQMKQVVSYAVANKKSG